MNGLERMNAALSLQEVDRVPIWFMRQAGRHLPEYREIAKSHSFWERCKDSDLCSKISLQPLARYKQIDSAIVFSDILTPLPSLGYEVEYGGGIRIDPFKFDDMDGWTSFKARKHAPWAANGLKAIGEEIGDEKAKIGFVGSPWTISMYLLSGGTGDKDFNNARALVSSNPEDSKRLLMKMGGIVGDLLADQVNSGGADVVQIFDTWAGLLSSEDYGNLSQIATERAIQVFREKSKKFVPLIHYAKGSGHLHSQIRDMDIQGLSLDWRDNMRHNREKYGEKMAFQGNLAPSKLHGSTDVARQAAARVLEEAGGKPGHIFNLGHGFAPSARIDCVEAVIRTVCGDIP